MRKVRITLPATVTNVGPGLRSLGLAVGLHTTIEISRRDDDSLVVEPEGEGAGFYSIGLRHPVVLGLMRIFQQTERAVAGLTIRIRNQIPLASGLGTETVFQVAGMIAANNMLGNRFQREELLELATEVTQQPDRVVTTLLGGLTTSLLLDQKLTYRNLPVTRVPVVVAVPDLPDYAEAARSVDLRQVELDDALYNLERLPLLLDALRDGDFDLLSHVMQDKLLSPHYQRHITGYEQVVEAARAAGARAVTISGEGPALVAFSDANHTRLANAMRDAFQSRGIEARTWTLAVDTQGVVISVAGSR